MIYHIYWGTAGNAGLYLDGIYQVLNNAGFRQKAFVSYYYPFNYGEKVFFRRTEMEHCSLKGKRRKLFQALEVLAAFFTILFHAKNDKPSVVNYSYVGSGNVLTLCFLKLIKKIGKSKLVITCHDVVPFSKNQLEYERELSIKRRIFKVADYYLIHNPESRYDLLRLFDVKESQILVHPFPIMDLSKLDNYNDDNNLLYDFLFLGHLRREKGIEFLLETWPEFHSLHKNAKLCIAGNPFYYKEYMESRREECKESNVELKLGFVSDRDYIALIKQSCCVVFPYFAGTNSGVISTVLSLNKNVLTSDISMFTSNPLISKDSIFKSGDQKSFLDALSYKFTNKNVNGAQMRINDYKRTFEKDVLSVYKVLNG